MATAQQQQVSPHPLLTDQVRRALRSALTTDDAQLDGVARRLGMTPRSLQRRLKDEGTVFQTVRDEMRRELADQYLKKGMSLAEISFLLGFSEPSAFFRAFKRWTGLTPMERRDTLVTG
jgi:AraC-like DNA-binding protein